MKLYLKRRMVTHPLRCVASALAVLLLLIACSEPKQEYQVLPAGTVVLAFGDSVTYGTGARSGEDYPSVLAGTTGWNIINAGIPGDTAAEARGRIADLLQEHKPRLVIVELGGNDFLRKRSASKVKQDLLEILQQIDSHGAMVALVGVPQLSLLRAGIGALKDSPIYREIADETGALLIPDVFANVLSDSDLRADQIHPNRQGYRVLSDGIAQEFKSVGLLN